ncbi:unnamed protein product (macronuclear) [Paramecium tetraurelia]|uniref:RING-type domain-containing protein n=1 Tax=Paramecium tetraurelia TaxID=5888 RepID=A0DAG1_PARTE|nr:uncharacterized protein GSPATT00014935001 [Paramecium tetraurelia]CAK80028.1 unnamed protein product [Paramecium tetraurelia]|eukprot:XP_001447425.1 hypothetical protein (macronuclear) [Paramecium tetraurelia strain d4-2]
MYNQRRNRKIIEDEELEDQSSNFQSLGNQNSSSQKKSSPNKQLCTICLEQFTPPLSKLKCNHLFCQICFDQFMKVAKKLQCPLCRQPFSYYDIYINQDGVLVWINKSENFYQKNTQESYSQLEESIFQESFLNTPSQSIVSASISEVCQVCLCNENDDQVIFCLQCRILIGHDYCIQDDERILGLCNSCQNQ